MTKHLDDLQEWSLDELVRFRICPYALKGKCLLRIGEGWRHDAGIESESVLFPLLSAAQLDDTSNGSFIYVHTYGTHIPITCDRNGMRITRRGDTLGDATEQAHFVLRKLAEFMDALRHRNLYDKMLIIVCADHGERFTPLPKEGSLEVPKCAFPMLWIKPVDAHGAFKKRDIPSTHERIAQVMRTSLTRTLSQIEIDSMISSKLRTFRVDLGGRRKDWIFRPDGTFSIDEGDFATFNELRPLTPGHVYSLLSLDKGERVDLLMSNVAITTHARRIGEGRASITFKVPDVSATYSVKIGIKQLPNPFAEFRKQGACNEPFRLVLTSNNNPKLNKDIPLGESAVFELKNLKPNSDGSIQLDTEKSGLRTWADIVSFQIVQE